MATQRSALFVLLLALGGCSSSPDKAGVDAAADAAEVDAADGSAVLPKAPTLTMLMPMASVLHVNWTNNDPTCESVEGERKTPTTPYQVVFTVPSPTDNKMDGTAKGDVDYTYRLRCLKGGVYSEYSNELTGNPTK